MVHVDAVRRNQTSLGLCHHTLTSAEQNRPHTASAMVLLRLKLSCIEMFCTYLKWSQTKIKSR